MEAGWRGPERDMDQSGSEEREEDGPVLEPLSEAGPGSGSGTGAESGSALGPAGGSRVAARVVSGLLVDLRLVDRKVAGRWQEAAPVLREYQPSAAQTSIHKSKASS